MRDLAISLAVVVAIGAPALGQEAAAYVGSDSCVGCHTDAAAGWAGSHHALAWTEPSPETIIADFDGTEFAHDGMRAEFSIEGDGYHVAVTETDGETTDYRVHSVIGIEPLQQYLLEPEAGRLQSFDVVWDTERGAWFHLYPDQDLPPEDGLHWTGPYKNWNGRCAECHATGYEKNYDPVSESFASIQAEIGVGCEACHGPGEAHLAWAEGGELTGNTNLDAYGFTMSFRDAEVTIQQCAGCHSRREAHGDGNPVPGTPYHDAFNLSLLRPGLYQADGQILDEVYVYGSFLQSRMYAAGVSCVDCHDPHTARLKADGNAVCTQCHSSDGRPDFPQAAGLYDSPEHHFHEPGSEGAQCRNCHMIERLYMGVDWRRDHSFRVPRPDLAGETGGPDACTDCHQDRTADWASETLAGWFPDSIHRGPHFGQTLARGREDPVNSAGDLADLAEDRSEPAIVRATALWLLEGASSPLTAGRLAPLLDDPDPIVRAAALGLQRTAPPTEGLPRVVGLLDDPVKSVRIAAARALIAAPIARLPDATAESYDAAMAEWQQSLSNRLDFPETHLQIGGTALVMRNPQAAFGAFREAVDLDPQLVDAWSMLVRIAAAVEGPEAARAVLDDALAANPEDPTLRQYDAELGR